ncbi:hypothetical protein J4E81_005230 [Alternaria sp. BMP 2799]|nr:hypothetical protein J4E81_005230 [Alternaria sp. BMP 2799]
MASPEKDYSPQPFTDDHLLWVLKMGVDRNNQSASHENIQLVGVYCKSANDEKTLQQDLYDYCHGDKVAEQNVVKHLPQNNQSKAKVVDCAVEDSANRVAFYIKFITEKNAAVAEKLRGLSGSDSVALYTVRGRSIKTSAKADSPKGIGEDIYVESNNNGGDDNNEEEMVDDDEEMSDDEEMVDEEPPIQIDALKLLGSPYLNEIVYTGGIEYYIGTDIKTFLDKKAAILEIRKQTEPTPGEPEYRVGPADAKGVIVAMTAGNGNNYFKNMSWVTKVVASGSKRADDYTLSFKD